MAKKYFWLKLKDDFFTDIRMKKLRRNAGGATYTLIYLKMQLLSLKKEGILLYEEVEDYFYEEIAFKIDEDPVDVEFTLMFLMKHNLLEEVRENEFALIETMNSIGSETDVAERVRKHREEKKEKNKMLHCNELETLGNTEIEKEIEKEINKKTMSPGKPDNVVEVIEKIKQLKNLPNARSFTDKRKKSINARIEEYGLHEVINVLNRMNNLTFFKENMKSSWYTIDWIFNPNNFIKVIEGKYDEISFIKTSYNNRNGHQPYIAEQNQYQEKEIIEVNEEDLPF